MAFNIGFYAYVIIGHIRANQLLPQLLMEQFATARMHSVGKWVKAHAKNKALVLTW